MSENQKTLLQTTQQTKRKLQETSPEYQNMSKKPVGNMEVSDLVELMKCTMSELLEDKLQNLPTKQDIEEVKAGISWATSEISDLKAENAKLKMELELLKNKIENNDRSIRWLENQVSNTKLVFKGIVNEKPAINPVVKLCTEKLQITPAIKSAKTIFERGNVQTVVVEFDNETVASEVLQKTRFLSGTSIYVDRDLCPRRQRNKVAMLLVRKDILQESKKHKIIVRDDKMKIKDYWFTWNNNNILTCGKRNAEIVLKELYGEELSRTNFDTIFDEIQSKNY